MTIYHKETAYRDLRHLVLTAYNIYMNENVFTSSNLCEHNHITKL